MRNEYHLSRAADLTALAAFRDLIDAACHEHPGIADDTRYDLKLAVDEAATVILTHGYTGMSPGSVMLELQFRPRQVEVTLTYFGYPFEPCDPGALDLQVEAGDETSECFHPFFIYQAMDEVRYCTAEDGNHLTFIKRLGAD